MDEFLELLKETAVFMLAGQMILHFLPGKKYAKYGKMIVGLLVLSQLVLPVLSLGQQDGSRIFLEKMGDWEADQELFSRKMEKLEEKEGTFLEHALLESVEEQLKNQADTAGVEVTEVRLKKDGTLLIEVMQQNNPKKADSVAAVTIAPVQISPKQQAAGKTGGLDGTFLPEAKQAKAGAKKGKIRTELAASFAAKLGMSAEKVEVMELE